jgi:hypothetical protein
MQDFAKLLAIRRLENMMRLIVRSKEAEAMLAQARAINALDNAKTSREREEALHALVQANKARRESSRGQ